MVPDHLNETYPLRYAYVFVDIEVEIISHYPHTQYRITDADAPK
jgi:hypothetical protein